ncbi:hypothetical protein [Streptomyces johnsoniae]|uniref:Nucleotide exchange factor GrpE n=1 Tax=Streptomyces johnsoniae TaxID=3075532 RepID=A0ABU2S679_9ACTN|nr:hypothetical protein [Streptomyces sp. DSM 41886]MDT0443354.1 hypothetical protein [Streptomyces sp. DSM 41886]
MNPDMTGQQEAPPDDSGQSDGQEGERGGWADLGAELADLSRRVDEHLKRLEGE